MAASLPPAPSSTPANPSGSIHERGSKLSMTPSTGASTASSPAKIDSVPATDKAEASTEAPVPTKPSKSGRRRDRNRDRKPKPKPKRETAKCVGYYVDALDKKMLWAEARIIRCNLTTQKIRVHFVGWSKNYDLWTDPMSITSHGRYAPVTKKEEGDKSWDGDMHLFEDMLGKIEEATFSPLPVPADDRPRVAPLPTAVKKSGDKKKKKKKAPSDKKKAPTDKEAPIAKPASARQLERPAPKRKASAISEDKTTAKGPATTAKTIERNGRKQEQPQSAKRSEVSAKPKENHEKRQEKQHSARTTKRQKREPQQPATASPKARASKKKRAPSPDSLPMFRDLELDDGTVVDFSEQREEAQAEREAMQGFLANCALIWKKQLSALSVQ